MISSRKELTLVILDLTKEMIDNVLKYYPLLPINRGSIKSSKNALLLLLTTLSLSLSTLYILSKKLFMFMPKLNKNVTFALLHL